MADEGQKRKAVDNDGPASKKAKVNKAWFSKSGKAEARAIKPGEAGIWVTCHKGKERMCIGEMSGLLAEYLQEDAENDDTIDQAGDVEANIDQEIADLKKPAQDTGITPVWTDIQCLVFFRTPSIDPEAMVRRIMEDTAKHPGRKRTRCTQRLTPCSLLGHASTEGLDKVARHVLAPHFHADPLLPKKFAIRPTIRNHSTLKRDDVIKQVATIVGTGHSVDLKNFDLLILVDINKNVCGVTVVGQEYERLKRYNLEELFEPSSHA